MFVKLAISTIWFTCGLLHAFANLHQPLYLSHPPSGYFFVENIRYKSATGEYILGTVEDHIYYACPAASTSQNYLEAVQSRRNRMVLGVKCENPIKALTLQRSNGVGSIYDVVFLIYEPNSNYSRFNSRYVNLHESFYPLALLSITIDNILKITRTVTHVINYGDVLPLYEYNESTTPIEYEKNKNELDFDVDFLYHPQWQQQFFRQKFGQNMSMSYSLVKVQLAPAADMFLETWQNATRFNMNTAPMWGVLQPQWAELEIFIRKVAKVLDRVSVTTGTTSVLHVQTRPLYLYEEDRYPVPRFFWKAITYHQLYNGQRYEVGIIFYMHNDPFTAASSQSPLCRDVSQENGWHIPKIESVEVPIYGCSLTSEYYDSVITESTSSGISIFDLKNVPWVQVDEDGMKELVYINVTNELEEL